ncbi:MAG: hypothetical protein QM750_09325 [Rubrivivax sp.]
MKPDPERSEQVVARVLAWHNRNPLAKRIQAHQVHSVGVVSLPFAVQGVQVQAVAETRAESAPEPQPELQPEPPADPPAEPAPAAVRVRWQVSGLPPRRPRWHPLAWAERLRGRHPYRALFSEDFIAPLRPPRVARWAAAHGSADWPLPPGAAQRLVMLDPALRRAGDGAAEVDLYLITAAVAIGDQRHRLLLAPGAGGAVLGLRHWSRQRLLGALPLLAGLLIAAGAAWPLRAPEAAPEAAAPQLAAAAAPPAEPVVAADAAPALPDEPTADAASAPPDADARPGTIDLPPLVPRLDDQQRRELRAAGRALRQAPAAAAAKAWALVTPLLRDRRQSERVAAQLQAVALLQAMPMRTELLPAGRGWRAVFWPFTSEQDAQKVRLALADKGLQTELLEF